MTQKQLQTIMMAAVARTCVREGYAPDVGNKGGEREDAVSDVGRNVKKLWSQICGDEGAEFPGLEKCREIVTEVFGLDDEDEKEAKKAEKKAAKAAAKLAG